jgi:ketosteroid isomerase-like protein
MSVQNVEIIRRSFEHFEATGDIEWDVFDPECETRDYDLPDAMGEVFRGREGYERWVRLWSGAWEDYDIDLVDVVDADPAVIAVFQLRARGRGSGIETVRENAAVYTIEGGKVTRCDYYGSTEGAFDAAGVPELGSRT